MKYRKIEMNVSLGRQQVFEFRIGDRIRHSDNGFGKSGEGVIMSFAQSGYDVSVWYMADDGLLHTVLLGWCEKIENGQVVVSKAMTIERFGHNTKFYNDVYKNITDFVKDYTISVVNGANVLKLDIDHLCEGQTIFTVKSINHKDKIITVSETPTCRNYNCKTYMYHSARVHEGVFLVERINSDIALLFEDEDYAVPIDPELIADVHTKYVRVVHEVLDVYKFEEVPILENPNPCFEYFKTIKGYTSDKFTANIVAYTHLLMEANTKHLSDYLEKNYKPRHRKSCMAMWLNYFEKFYDVKLMREDYERLCKLYPECKTDTQLINRIMEDLTNS